MKRRILALGMLSLCALICTSTAAEAWFGWANPWHHHNRYVTHITCRPYNAFTPICWGNLVCDGCCPPAACGAGGSCMPLAVGAPPCCYGGYPMGGVPYSPVGSCGPDGCCASDMAMHAPPIPVPMPGGHALPSGPGWPGAVPGGPGGHLPPGGPGWPAAVPGGPGGHLPPAGPAPLPDIRTTPPFAAPMPTPFTPGHTMNYSPYGNGIMQANYYPQQYPGYYPAYNPWQYPMQMPMGYNPYYAWPNPTMPYYWYGHGR